MIWLSDIASEIEKAKWYAEQPERFVVCGRGWKMQGNHHQHRIRVVRNRLRCSCGTFKCKALMGQPWCEHTRAVEMLMTIGKLKRPKPITSSPSAPNDLVLFVPT